MEKSTGDKVKRLLTAGLIAAANEQEMSHTKAQRHNVKSNLLEARGNKCDALRGIASGRVSPTTCYLSPITYSFLRGFVTL